MGLVTRLVEALTGETLLCLFSTSWTRAKVIWFSSRWRMTHSPPRFASVARFRQAYNATSLVSSWEQLLLNQLFITYITLKHLKYYLQIHNNERLFHCHHYSTKLLDRFAPGLLQNDSDFIKKCYSYQNVWFWCKTFALSEGAAI